MMTVEFEFGPNLLQQILAGFLSLPPHLRPTHFSDDEGNTKRRWAIRDETTFTNFFRDRETGFFLSSVNIDVLVSSAPPKNIDVYCTIEKDASWARVILEALAPVQPIFGFACDEAERLRRNRLLTKKSINSVEAWVGRDTNKYIPGLYWMTLLSDVLAKRHQISLDTLSRVAPETVEIAPGQHLFQFYDQPEDWKKASEVDKIISSLPGIFDIDRIKEQAEATKTVMELHAVTMLWK